MKNFIKDLLDYNNLDNNIKYVEPYAGGAGLALHLLYNNIVSEIHINDFDFKIYSVWYSIINYTNDFINLIQNTEISLDSWEKQKYIYNNYKKFNILEVGFATFFLNRTNVSGIITGGPIGGQEQNKINNIDSRFNKIGLIQKVKKISSFEEKIKLSNQDAEFFIDNKINQLNFENTFIFFDPPYYKQGKNLYSNFYKHEDHLSLCNKISQIEHPYWIITYDYVSEINELYSSYPSILYTINYSANKVRKEYEFLAHSKYIRLPESNNIKYLQLN
ncbi:DNA adenine methylase [Aquisalibacillus elongatus]|uniref:site-specific DNA-methyltransferase (adenine-specific) n=1 Tax=Aquisalibacillus elongatus TaxID=485577 RepID=A0A3N5BWQ4_9BACI|nr:DNA adenine methylase [Aquisalibacillus elongatus]RPF50305.1 DNA adenine methylase [Aquisalibacillus elongatus]